MVEPSEKTTVCGLCERELELNSQILINGCPFCGSFKFKTYRKNANSNIKEKELELIVENEIEGTEIQDGVEAIRLTIDGVFEVDIDKLLADSDEESPIIGRNKDGSYFIKFQKEKEENS